MKLKKKGSTGRNSLREENKLEKNMAIKLRRPTVIQVMEGLKPYIMYSFYKNTLTFNCCFSNLSLFEF